MLSPAGTEVVVLTDLVIFGAGGMAREVHQIVEDLGADGAPWNFLGFLDGDAGRHGEPVHDHAILGDAAWAGSHPQVAVVVAVGSTPARRRIVLQLAAAGATRFATLVHPRAWIGNRVSVGSGSIVCAGTRITTDNRIGRHVILNVDCTVSHDAVIEDYVTLAPGVHVCGNTSVGEGCDLGTGTSIIQGVGIGQWTVLGAGALVLDDVPRNVTAVGAPARVIKERPEGWHLD